MIFIFYHQVNSLILAFCFFRIITSYRYFRTRTFESEFCMSCQMRTNNLLYNFFIPMFKFYMPVTCILFPSWPARSDIL